MKKLLLGLVFISTSIIGVGQSYNQFTNNVGWCMTESIALGYWLVEEKNTGDTLFNSVNYKKFTGNNGFTNTLVREDSIQKKVWAIMPDSTSETLLYDFNLVAGNQVTLDYVGYYPVTYQVDSVDSITTLLGSRKRINLSTTDTLFATDLVWIEGIGSTYGPIYLLQATFDGSLANTHGGHTLSCCYQNVGVQSYVGSGIACWLSYPQGACGSFVYPTSIEDESIKDNISIYPNPSSNDLTIENLGNQKNDITVEIRSITGKLELEKHIGSFEKITINTDQISSGIYFISIKGKQSVIATKKWVKMN